MIRFEIQPIYKTSYSVEAVQASELPNAWGVYFRGSDNLARHIEDFKTFEEANRFRDIQINNWNESELEQVGIFMSDLDMDQISDATKDRLEGFNGLNQFIIDEAQKFQLFHYEAMLDSGNEDYWCDEINGSWYEASDLWFDGAIAGELYEARQI